MNEIDVKLDILENSLKKKKALLTQILNITENQEMFLKNLSGEEKENYLKSAAIEKQNLIDDVLRIDSVFISTFESFNGMLNQNRQIYRSRILELQEEIRAVVDIDLMIRAKEERNKQLFIPKQINKSPALKSLKANKNYILDQYAKNSKKQDSEK